MCFSGSRVICYGFNKPKTEASISKHFDVVDYMYDDAHTKYVSSCRHAEVDAIKKLPNTDKVDTIIVVRKTKNREIGMARPCNICVRVIKETGIKNIYYSNEDGIMQRMIYE